MEDRRTFLATLGAAALGVSARRAIDRLAIPLDSTESTKIARVGIQLYTVRTRMPSDMAGTLERLAKIGYKEVEFAGYFKHPATEVREMLRANGLTAPSVHVGIEDIETDSAQTFADAKTIGHEFITVASLPSPDGHTRVRAWFDRATADDWKRLAARFNVAGKTCKSAGFRFAFHNHDDIVRKTGDVLPIDILMHETDPALVSYEMDIYWAVNAGADPLQLLAAYPGRFSMFHAKDSMGPPDHNMADVGAGVIDFKTIFARAKGIEHYFVEHDSPPDPLASAAASYRYLANLEF